MKKQGYANNEKFQRRYLYIEKANSRKLDVAAAKNEKDVSQILNEALAAFFSKKEKG